MNATATAARVTFDEVSKRYPDGTLAVDRLSLDVPPGEVAVLVGPSGCGKTTTMRMVNRLVAPTSGRVLLDGADVATADAVRLRRTIGYVIQQVGLFPHVDVAGNVATVPRLLGWDRGRVRRRVTEMLELVGLDPATHAGRYPHELSGGQRQRVGVARALAADPPVLLMDEPFGAIDPIARERLQDEFLRLQEQVGKTVVFVTHDVDEAVRVGDRIAVLAEGGHLEQYDAPAALLAAPATPFVDAFLGTDRGLRRLAVLPVERDQLDALPAVATQASLAEVRRSIEAGRVAAVVVVSADGTVVGQVRGDELSRRDDAAGVAGDLARPMPVVRLGSPLRVAVSEIFADHGSAVAVVDGDGRYVGAVTPETLARLARR